MLIVHISLKTETPMKNKVLQIRVEDIDHKRLQKEAKKLGLTLSAFVRLRVLLDLQDLQKLNLDGIDQKKAK